jgi:hypothetical protein
VTPFHVQGRNDCNDDVMTMQHQYRHSFILHFFDGKWHARKPTQFQSYASRCVVT